MRHFVRQVLNKYALSEIEINRLVLALDEVCANLIIHKHKCSPNRYIHLKINIVRDKKVTFEIIDNGLGFNITSYEEPSIGDILTSRRKGGLGLMLVKRIMDDIQYEANSNTCTYRLIKIFHPVNT